MILPDSGIEETAIAQHGLLVPKWLAKFPSSGAEAAKEGPFPPLVKHAGPCLHVGPNSITNSHCQPMQEGASVQTAELAGWKELELTPCLSRDGLGPS